MKKTILILFTFLLSSNIFAQNNLSETEKFAFTGKVWGFLKYYHPEVADGKYNWDEELFKILPKVKAVANNKELSQVYLDWIKSLGEIKPCKKCDVKNNVEYDSKIFKYQI